MSFHPESRLSPGQLAQLDGFERLLRTPGARRGMVGRGDLGRLRERHIDDALRGVGALPPATRDVCDIGSGGGIPGLVLAVARPEVGFVLVERRANRADFLDLVVRELGVTNVEIHAGDVAGLHGRAFEVCTARAFAPPAETWLAAERLLATGGRLVYWAGRTFDPAAGPPPGASLEVFADAEVAGSGPVVIMSRQ